MWKLREQGWLECLPKSRKMMVISQVSHYHTNSFVISGPKYKFLSLFFTLQKLQTSYKNCRYNNDYLFVLIKTSFFLSEKTFHYISGWNFWLHGKERKGWIHLGTNAPVFGQERFCQDTNHQQENKSKILWEWQRTGTVNIMMMTIMMLLLRILIMLLWIMMSVTIGDNNENHYSAFHTFAIRSLELWLLSIKFMMDQVSFWLWVMEKFLCKNGCLVIGISLTLNWNKLGSLKNWLMEAKTANA